MRFLTNLPVGITVTSVLCIGCIWGVWAWRSRPLAPVVSVVDDQERESQILDVLPARLKPAPESPRPRSSSSRGASESRADERSLIKNWNLKGTGLSPEDVAPFLSISQPESIMFFHGQGIKRIYPERYELGQAQSSQTLFIGTREAIQKTAQERVERMHLRSTSGAQDVERSQGAQDLSATEAEKGSKALPHNAYEIVAFRPGKRDDGTVLEPVAKSLISSIQGPDYSLANIDSGVADQMIKLLSRVLSFGHAGELLLKVSDGGDIEDREGFDFAIYENAFRIMGTNKIFQEFGYVGVSESGEPEDFRWFPCDPKAGVVLGCAGAVPTAEGGDQFDLAEVGIKRVRYVWIKDTGINKNFPSKWPTEGLDLDALRFEYAFVQK